MQKFLCLPTLLSLPLPASLEFGDRVWGIKCFFRSTCGEVGGGGESTWLTGNGGSRVLREDLDLFVS